MATRAKPAPKRKRAKLRWVRDSVYGTWFLLDEDDQHRAAVDPIRPRHVIWSAITKGSEKNIAAAKRAADAVLKANGPLLKQGPGAG